MIQNSGELRIQARDVGFVPRTEPLSCDIAAVARGTMV